MLWAGALDGGATPWVGMLDGGATLGFEAMLGFEATLGPGAPGG